MATNQEPITFQVRPQCRVKALLCGIIQNHQQAAAEATQSVYCSQEAAEKQRKAPPHLGRDPQSEADAGLRNGGIRKKKDEVVGEKKTERIDH